MKAVGGQNEAVGGTNRVATNTRDGTGLDGTGLATKTRDGTGRTRLFYYY